MMRHPTHRPSATPPAFTLIEVLLAVGLATALLLAALFFYRQAAQLRSDILQSSRAIAALRLALDQLASDLRAAVPAQGHAFVGGPASLEFTRFSTPSPASPSTNLAHNPPDAPLAVVFLSTLIQTDGCAPAGLKYLSSMQPASAFREKSWIICSLICLVVP